MGTKLCKRIACMLFFAMMLNPIGISEEVYGDTPAHLVAPAELGEIDLPMDETVPDDDITVEVSSSTEVFESEAYTATEELLSVESTDEFAVAAPAGFQTALTLGVKEQYMLDGASLADGQSVTYISDTKVTLYTNDGYQLTATLTKNSIAEINWTSDNPEVASVDEYGFVIAESIGKATITATTDNGKRAKCKVTVKERENSGTVADGVRGTVIHHEESDTLKVTIANDKGVYLTYIWAKDPSRQLYKHYGNSQPGNMLQDAVNASGLQSKIVVGFNASPPSEHDLLP